MEGEKLTKEMFDVISTEGFGGEYGPGLKSDPLASVKKNEKWGFIGVTGELRIPCKYDEVEEFSDHGWCRVKVKGKLGYIDTRGTEYFED